MTHTIRHPLACLTALLATAATSAAVGTSAATAATSSMSASSTPASNAATSTNWAGYVAEGRQFSSVSGSWVVPGANCGAGAAGSGPGGSGATYSAFWIGLGGSSGAQALEQTGTQSDCSADGTASYYAWYELVPAAPVKLPLTIAPGDHISARVSVSGSSVNVVLSDTTTGQSATRSLTTGSIDTSSAEWIAEAPSSCDGAGNCQPLPLANFGTAQFSGATATADGHTGPISDPSWQAQPVALDGSASGATFAGYPGGDGSTGAGATPSTLSSDGGAFSVSWQSAVSGSARSYTDTSGGGTSYPDGSGGGGNYLVLPDGLIVQIGLN